MNRFIAPTLPPLDDMLTGADFTDFPDAEANENRSTPPFKDTCEIDMKRARPPHGVRVDPTKLREFRELRGLSVLELAEKAGLNVRSVIRYENGKQPVIQYKAFRSILSALRIRAELILVNGHKLPVANAEPPEPTSLQPALVVAPANDVMRLDAALRRMPCPFEAHEFPTLSKLRLVHVFKRTPRGSYFVSWAEYERFVIWWASKNG